jgi:hypothetical protein
VGLSDQRGFPCVFYSVCGCLVAFESGGDYSVVGESGVAVMARYHLTRISLGVSRCSQVPRT